MFSVPAQWQPIHENYEMQYMLFLMDRIYFLGHIHVEKYRTLKRDNQIPLRGIRVS